MANTDITSRIDEMIRARGAEYERLVQDRRERERVRKREARKRQTPEQCEREKERERAGPERNSGPLWRSMGKAAGPTIWAARITC